MESVKPQSREEEHPTVVDLFCGAGGLSFGIQRAGFVILAAYDSWKPAVETYRLNFKNHVSQVSITESLAAPKPSVMVGGPPCQGFSSAGMRRPNDHRNSLVGIFSNIVAPCPADSVPLRKRGRIPDGL